MLTTHEVVTSEALGDTLAGIQWDVMLLDQVLTHPLSIRVGTLLTLLSRLSQWPPGSHPAGGSLGRDSVSYDANSVRSVWGVDHLTVRLLMTITYSNAHIYGSVSAEALIPLTLDSNFPLRG